MIQIKRAYDPPAAADGKRYLVERLWPRGVRREALYIDGWTKDLAPSTALRQWFHADPARWPEFRQRYLAELDANAAACSELLAAARSGALTLLYGAHDTQHNSAIVLKEFLEHRLARHAGACPQSQSGTTARLGNTTSSLPRK